MKYAGHRENNWQTTSENSPLVNFYLNLISKEAFHNDLIKFKTLKQYLSIKTYRIYHGEPVGN